MSNYLFLLYFFKGTSSEDASKPERELSGVKKRCANSEDTENSSSYRKSNTQRNPPKVKRPSLKEKVEKDESSEIYQANEPTDYLWSTSDDARSPDKINSPSSSRKNLYRNSLNVFQLHSLQPYFTPISLSDSSLKHLEESPVLHPSGSQTSDHKGQPSTSLSRKWSERRSPLEKSRLTLRKRSRQDSH